MSTVIHPTILAGSEIGLPADSPSGRLDVEGRFGFVGAVEVADGVSSFKGSAVALSREWVLTAGHNADFNDDGFVDASWSGTLHLPELGSFPFSQVYLQPDYTGFGRPTVNDDLALIRLSSLLPEGLEFPSLGGGVLVGDVVTLVGFGRSGYGNYGYTSNASLTDRRFGSNVIDSFEVDDEGRGWNELFRYDFDHPSSTGLPDGSLGNEIESIIGPGDSGGAALKWNGEEWVLVGVNTFTEGFGGRFGDIGGGVLVEPYREWILETTVVPESGTSMFIVVGFLALIRRRKGRG